MSIVQLNIRTRIELETRVLAAALKQSFERGDSDGVSLAHRQLFLLLKDQKAGNGASTQTETEKSKNGDAARHSPDTNEIQEQPNFAPAAFSEPEMPDFDEQSETTADIKDFQAHRDSSEAGHDYAEAAEVEPAPGYGEVAEVEHRFERQGETQSQFEHGSEIEPGFDSSGEAEESGTGRREKSAFEILEEAYEAELARQRVVEEASREPESVSEQMGAMEDTDDVEHAPVIEVEIMREEPLEFSQDIYEEQSVSAHDDQQDVSSFENEEGVAAFDDEHGARTLDDQERAAAFDEQRSVTAQTGDHPVADAKENQYQEAEGSEQAQAIQQYLRYKKTREQVLAQEVADRFAAHKAAEAEAGAQAQGQSQMEADAQARAQIRAAVEAEAAARMEAEAQASEASTSRVSEEEQYIRMRKKEPPKKAELPFDAPSDEYAKVFGTTTQAEKFSKSNRASQSDTGDFATPAGEAESDVDFASSHMGQAFSHAERAEAGAGATEQESDYETRKADQSRPRNMPAIDFSLSSEAPAAKPDIDFSLSSEVSQAKPNIDFSLSSEAPPAKPNIDFSLSSEAPTKPDIDFSLGSDAAPKTEKPKLPDIDFSLESETPSKGPDIDFSLESESKAKSAERDFLSAPAGGGFIEAEFVSKETDANADEYANQDVTSELPVLNPNASLYVQPDEAQAPGENAPHSQPPEPTPAAFGSVPPRPPVDPASLVGLPRLAAPTAKPVEPAPEVAPPLTAAQAQETTSQEEPIPPVVPRPPDLYALLGVSQMSPFEEIHKNFLRKIRRILRKLRGTVRPERDELLKDLRRHWVARDILCDPVTRTDYDFRDMGLRGAADGAPQIPDDGPQRIGQRTPLRIGELLQCAGLLEMAELEIACDMHKAMPEVQFGTFLVRQGFIQERDLESVLLGQSLLREGKITVAQFQVAMELSQSRGANIADTLIEHGYINAAELQKLTNKQVAPEPVAEADLPKIKEIEVKPRAVEPPPSNLNASSAVPTWKDQLDWSKPLPVDDDASLMDRDPQKQSLANLLGGKPESGAPTEAEVVKITNNAAPSWKDQLDWDKPEEEAQGNEPQEAQAGLNATNAVPSWKDQIDWEEPKSAQTAESTANSTNTGKEFNTISSGMTQEHEDETDELSHDDSEAHDSDDAHADDDPEREHTTNAAENDSVNPDQPQEKEGFFKKSFGKFRKGDSKDKKKKRK